MFAGRTLARLGATAGAAGLLTLGLAAPASAHVTVTPSDTTAGAYVVLTFSVPHGCDGSATTGITIQLPEEITSVTPTRNPYYDVQVAKRVGEVTYTSKLSLPDGYRDAVELSLQLPDAAGETLAFPVLQTCEQGQTGWTEVAAEGQDPEELEHPAPLVTITSPAETATVEPSESEDTNVLGIGGLVVGAVGVAVGCTALARTRREP